MKRFFKKNLALVIIGSLLLLNVFMFSFTRNYLYSESNQQTADQKNPLYSYLYSGWQIIDWSMSMIDYVRHMGDKK